MRLAIAILVIFTSALVKAQDLEVRKEARKSNPTLRITGWQGSTEFREMLQDDIKLSDWFELTWSEEADYYLKGSTEKVGPEGLQATLTLTTAAGQSWKVSHSMNQPAWLAHVLTDSLISNAFQNPGFCATYLAYVKAGKKQTKDIWVSQFNGSGARQVTNNNTITTEPCWSHDNNYLTYMVYSHAQMQAILYDFNNNRWRTLTRFPGLNASCRLANTDLRAAICLSKDGQVDLYSFWTGGKTLKRMTTDSNVEASPTWSPDDKQLCYVSNHGRKPTLFTISADGGEPNRILNTLEEAVSPDWSKVSNKICFSIKRGGQYVIAVTDMNTGTGEISIPFAAAGDWEAPTWTADGRHLVCSRTYMGTTALYLVDTWYGKVSELTACGKDVTLPACSSSFIRSE